MDALVIRKVSGLTLTLRGNEIDTDRIIPARFLKSVNFEGLEYNIFANDRKQLKARGKIHPFDQKIFANASLLLVNKNFGCGSSREHAPQAIKRWGIKAIIGESYSEIFLANSVSIGIVCVTTTKKNIEKLMNYNEANPQAILTVDLDELTLSNNNISIAITIVKEIRKQFLSGTWDTTAELLKASEQIKIVAQGLPYFN